MDMLTQWGELESEYNLCQGYVMLQPTLCDVFLYLHKQNY